MGFDNVVAQVNEQLDARETSPESNQERNHLTEVKDSSAQDQATSQAIYELEKLGRFKYQGKEWTPKDLESAMLRQQDYTKKTQTLAKDRESFDQERKFYENLAWDLENCKNNPNLVAEFIKIYPQKFHSILKDYISNGSVQMPRSNQPQQQQQGTGPDINLLSRLDKLEKFYDEQEIAKNELVIKSTVEEMSKKYPDAIPDLVLSRAYEAHNSGVELTKEVWDRLFKEADDQVKSLIKDRYGEKVKKQTAANAKARDVDAGGGTVGRAPQKLSFKEIREQAIRDLSGR